MIHRALRSERIFTPGPVEIPARIREVFAKQIIHHRTPEFTKTFLETRELFKKLTSSQSDNFVFFSASGTGAMEAAVLNFFREGDKVIAIAGGKFGERWAELCQRWNLKTTVLEVEWGKSVNPEDVEDVLKNNPDCKGVFVQMSESSTGALHDIRELARITAHREALLVVDAITALGVYDIKPEEYGVDVLIGGSQKAFMLPPGLSMLWFSEKAKEKLTDRAYYFNIKSELEKQKDGQTAWTPAIPHIIGLKESISMLLEEGIEKVENRYRLISLAMKRAIESAGFEIFPENPSISLTVVKCPGKTADDIRKGMLRVGVRVAGGQGRLKGKVFRISHMGMDVLDMVVATSALDIALKKCNLSYTGTATASFLKTVMENC